MRVAAILNVTAHGVNPDGIDACAFRLYSLAALIAMLDEPKRESSSRKRRAMAQRSRFARNDRECQTTLARTRLTKRSVTNLIARRGQVPISRLPGPAELPF
jgi:hypothetical protein